MVLITMETMCLMSRGRREDSVGGIAGDVELDVDNNGDLDDANNEDVGWVVRSPEFCQTFVYFDDPCSLNTRIAIETVSRCLGM